MDLSALIFVALAIAWAAYLLPKALKHHDDAVRSRSVDRFSHTMRVLARREPVDRRSSRLVVTPGRPVSEPVVATKPSSAAAPAPAPAPVDPAPVTTVVSTAAPAPAERRARREAAARAARRRRRVLGVLLVLNAVVVTLAATGVLLWWPVAVPATLLVAWLVACRLMVRQEHASLASARTRGAAAPRPTTVEPMAATAHDGGPDDDGPRGHQVDEVGDDEVVIGEVTEEIAVTHGAETEVHVQTDVHLDPALWDPVPMTLPTYVTKPAAARRTVRTIDLDDTGVWTSGRTEADSRLAREAEEADRADRAEQAARDGDNHRAVGS